MHKIREKLMKELKELESKEIGLKELPTIHVLTDTIKNLDKIEMLEDAGYSYGEDEYSEARGGNRGGGRGGNRGGGRQSRNSYEGGGGSSYERGGNSYNDYSYGYGAERMIERIEDMMEDAEDDKQKDALRKCIQQLRRG